MCSPEEYVCCTYNPPTPPPTPAPTTPKPYITCSTNMACVAARDCRNGEILSNAVVNLEVSFKIILFYYYLILFYAKFKTTKRFHKLKFIFQRFFLYVNYCVN